MEEQIMKILLEMQGDMKGMRQDFSCLQTSVNSLETKVDLLDTKVNSLETKVDSLDTKVNSLETKVDSLDTKVNSLETKVDSLESKVDSLDTSVGSLQTDMTEIKQRVTDTNIIIEGDIRKKITLLAEGHIMAVERSKRYDRSCEVLDNVRDDVFAIKQVVMEHEGEIIHIKEVM